MPIFDTRRLPESGFECLVEDGHDSWLWVLGPDSPGGEMIGRAIAYWLWQVANDIDADLDRLRDANGVVRFAFDLAPEELWLPRVQDLAPRPIDSDQPFSETYALDRPPNGLRLLEGAWLTFHNADNSAERQLLRDVLDLAIDREDQDRAARIEQLVEKHAPPGYKKNVMLVRGADPRLNEVGLPPYRPVQQHDRVKANAAVSGQVLKNHKPVLADDEASAQQILHAYVAAAFQELEERMAALSPIGLLEQLVLLNERVVNEQAQRSFSMLTRTLGYGALDEQIAARPNEYVRLTDAAICTRFLVEYVTTCPPTGSKPFSVGAFDELLALAREILEAGSLSDALRAELLRPTIVVFHPRIVLLKDDGRRNDDETFVDEQLASELASGDQILEELAWKPEEEELGTVPAKLDRAFQAEFGLDIVRIFTGLNALLDFAIECDGGLVVQPVADVIELLGALPDWTVKEAEGLIDLFALSSRSSFLDPAPHGLRDVYPWRTNRSLSYIRRPLLRRGDELICGVRHLFSAVRYFGELIDDARYPAKSRELQRLQLQRGNAVGRAFESAVADVFDAHAWQVKKRVSSIAGLKLLDPDSQPLGDIDVLAVDETKRRVVVADAKAHKPGSSAAAIGTESAELFGPGRKSATGRQLARAAWVRDHLDRVLSDFDIDVEDLHHWMVEPLIVTALPLVSTFLTRPTVRVASYARLKEELAKA